MNRWRASLSKRCNKAERSADFTSDTRTVGAVVLESVEAAADLELVVADLFAATDDLFVPLVMGNCGTLPVYT